MDFMEALKLAMSVIREHEKRLDEIDEIYVYELASQTRVYLKDCKGSLEFYSDEPLDEQIFLASFLDKRLQSRSLSLNVICSEKWEVRFCLKTQHLKATRARLGKTAEFIDYTPVGREEVADV